MIKAHMLTALAMVALIGLVLLAVFYPAAFTIVVLSLAGTCVYIILYWTIRDHLK